MPAGVSAAASARGGRGGNTASRRCRSRTPVARRGGGVAGYQASRGEGWPASVQSCGVGRALTGREHEVEQATHPLGAALAEPPQQRLVVRVVGEVDVKVSEREDL